MPEQIQDRLIEEEMKSSYIDYSMSVITARALPDARDGLKPVHRRILYTMYGMNLMNNKPFVKSARIVGDCFKYHPHGDAAIYDSLVRMAQDFSLRYPLVNGHGNFGSIDFPEPAQMRYSEARLSKIGEELLCDLDKDTVDFIPNFDGSLKEPLVLSSKIPNLLINGSSGIAVGMATNIPPHHINEVIDAINLVIDNNQIEIDELIKVIHGPDFPTGGIIAGKQGIIEAYETGRGKIIVKAKAEIEKNNIIITEIPYQVDKTLLIKSIARLVKEKRVDGITDIRDESDKKGMRLVIILKKNVKPEIILNQLYQHTQLQNTFGIIMLALEDNKPKILNLKDLINIFIKHRKDVTTRRLKFELRKAEERSHILEGLKIALSDVDNVVKLIKSSDTVEQARLLLIQNFSLTKIQAQAILDMKLQRLTSLETSKIKEEYDNLIKLIAEFKSILASDQKIFEIIKNELLELKQKYSDKRRTVILEEEEKDLEREELIPKEDVVITVTKSGYIKQTPLTLYKQQRRGGKGIIATETKEEDVVENLFITSNHNYLLFFTNKGNVHWLKAYEVPEASRYARGNAIINLLNLEKDEFVNTLIPISEFDEKHFLLMITKNGILKKTALSEYSRPRKGGIIAINLRENDRLIDVKLTDGSLNFIIATKKGNAVKFNEEDVRAVGRNSTGVRGITLEDDEVIGMEVALDNSTLLTVTENGFGKRTNMEEYRLIRRGGKGVINIQCSERNGCVVGIKTVFDKDEVLLISEKGVMIRMAVKDISVISRNTQGVKLMKLDEGDKITTLAKVISNGD